MKQHVFDCKMCGNCCTGKGGIVLGPKDLVRLCAYFNMQLEIFTEKYVTMRNGKPTVSTDTKDTCVFFIHGQGCIVHEFKPDVCKAWPFFRGNLVDSISFEFARDFCPGIGSQISHEEFIQEGKKYLHDNLLLAENPTCEAHALLPTIHTTYSTLSSNKLNRS